MAYEIRVADPSDQEEMADLLLQDARQRYVLDPTLWALKESARQSILAALSSAMEAESPPFRQQWLVAVADGTLVGVIHSILLPVPPIYAGLNGAPGLIMEDSFVLGTAPAGVAEALLAAAEDDLRAAGAKVLLASCVPGGSLRALFDGHGYAPLTLYFGKRGLTDAKVDPNVCKARDDDIPSIVSLSAEHRQILGDLDPFWEPHPDADARFGNWMRRSLTLTDRDMFVSGGVDQINGYAISQPATPLHFPPAHDISATGIIDDFYHTALRDPETLGEEKVLAVALFAAAESALASREDAACLVVCPAAWASKIALLEGAGYANQLIWMIKR